MSKAAQRVQEGQALHRAGRLREAAAAYQQALADHPDYGPALHYLGLALIQQGMADMGRSLLEKALQQGQESPGLCNDLGLVHERAGHWQDAAQHYRRACQLAPTDAAHWQSLARVLGRMDDQDGVRQALQSLLRAHPDHVPTLVALARDAYTRNDRAAIDYCARARSIDARVAQQITVGFVEPDGLRTAGNGAPGVLLADGASQAQVDAVMAGTDLHIIDDFLDDPDAARQWAKGLEYQQRGGNYPGAQTGPLACDDMMQRLANRLGRRIKWISPDNGVVRITLAADQARTDIHVDDETAVDHAHYAAVLYLTLPEHCAGGTSFWRHRATGWVKRPTDTEIRAAGYADFKSFLRRETPQAEPHAFDTLTQLRSHWVQLFTVPMRYNRLVLYRSNYFHAVESLFGQSFDDGRLVRLFTFEFC
ncbi:MAG: tetratricopeptide repeat protein [Burkholderiales bacterium]|nr:tetratricopeptide repeat protein [Burkholderiales bacterium]